MVTFKKNSQKTHKKTKFKSKPCKLRTAAMAYMFYFIDIKDKNVYIVKQSIDVAVIHLCDTPTP